MEKIADLSQKVVDAIISCKNEKWEADQLGQAYVNQLLREDVLDILDKYCTVIYFPLEEEDNNGFHITGILDRAGNSKHFVFINTSQTMEKQVFTAAHELGHIWKVDEYVEKALGISLEPQQRESVINRFSAELLMPHEIFKAAFYLEYAHVEKIEKGQITVENALKLAVTMMNQFFVPYKSIILRFLELGFVAKPSVKLLLGAGTIPYEVIQERVSALIHERGLIKFETASKKRWIAGLADLLNEAEAKETVSQSKIDSLRKEFGLQHIEPNTRMDEILDIGADKE